MTQLEFKKHKDKYEINLFHNKNSKSHSKSHYTNIIDHDPKKIAQILIDLHLEGFRIDDAIKIYLGRVKNRDWLGL